MPLATRRAIDVLASGANPAEADLSLRSAASASTAPHATASSGPVGTWEVMMSRWAQCHVVIMRILCAEQLGGALDAVKEETANCNCQDRQSGADLGAANDGVYALQRTAFVGVSRVAWSSVF